MPATLPRSHGGLAERSALGRRIYLDHHATTPLDPRVLARMMPFFTGDFGNAASQDHAWGWAAADAVEWAREAVARFVHATADEIVFTSGATESTNLALLGVAGDAAGKRHFVTTAVEHASVLGCIARLRQLGHTVTIVPVDRDGRVDPARVQGALRPETLLVSVQSANNEVGTLQPITEIGAICQSRGILLHVDAAQSAAWVPLDVQADGIDLLSLSAHKLYGPKGIGALFVRRRRPRIPLAAITCGGGQEHGLRPGTVNVPAIVGFAEACALVQREGRDDAQRVAGLRDDLWQRIAEAEPAARRNGHPRQRLPNNLHITLPGYAAEQVIRAMTGIALSSGSACASDRREPSHVLRAMGRDLEGIHSSLRFGLGRSTTGEEVACVAERLAEVLARSRR